MVVFLAVMGAALWTGSGAGISAVDGREQETPETYLELKILLM